MKIEYITGCIYNDLKIDKKNVNNVSIDELKTICKKLIDGNNDSDSLQQIIIDYLYQVGPKDAYKCEDCGDWVEIFELNV